ncbi:CAMK family protein kinase [Tritrichomonas foetus]|uniref:non-specific serine/threonine protein kinase n=1 Tax=Tritrichomonas foetus TaxID=1144522 RepID=A0A1J4JU32_9EUKA|nr:CAMK family protein kinase [Tritrichomonas foetus]|eukprot:OHT02655.1 CAMK family protein kinase [Tritrichomonas foetus]
MGKVVGGYRFVKTIGIGSQSKTKVCVHMDNGKLFAIKQFPKELLENCVVQERLHKIYKFNHPFFLSVIDVLKSETNGYIVSELSEGGELFSYSHDFSETRIQVCFIQPIDALLFLHSQGLFIGNLKPEKLMLSKDHHLKITDFSLSVLPQTTNSPYSAPESNKSELSDIYSAGLILYSLITRKIPQNNSPLNFEGVSQGAIDLITKMTESVPDKRISLHDVKCNDWLNGIKETNDQKFEIKNVSESNLVEEISRVSELTAFEIVGKAMSVDLKALVEGPLVGYSATSFTVEDSANSVYQNAKQKLIDANYRCVEKENKAFVAHINVDRKILTTRVEVFERNPTSTEVIFYRLTGEPLDFVKVFNEIRTQFAE